MKKCRTVKGLSKAIQNKEEATLEVYDVDVYHHDKEGAYLNLGNGKYAGVSGKEWRIIRNHIVNSNGNKIKNIQKYKHFFN